MARRLCKGFALAIALLVLALPARAEIVVDTATVIDGDTLEIRGQRIRLHGIDAPEGDQICRLVGQPYRCGQRAALVLANRIGRRSVSCREVDRDRYNRIAAVCRLTGQDLNAWLVNAGWALAYEQYSTEYVDEAARARAARRGLWQGQFIEPWAWGARASGCLPRATPCSTWSATGPCSGRGHAGTPPCSGNLATANGSRTSPSNMRSREPSHASSAPEIRSETDLGEPTPSDQHRAGQLHRGAAR